MEQLCSFLKSLLPENNRSCTNVSYTESVLTNRQKSLILKKVNDAKNMAREVRIVLAYV